MSTQYALPFFHVHALTSITTEGMHTAIEFLNGAYNLVTNQVVAILLLCCISVDGFYIAVVLVAMFVMSMLG